MTLRHDLTQTQSVWRETDVLSQWLGNLTSIPLSIKSNFPVQQLQHYHLCVTWWTDTQPECHVSSPQTLRRWLSVFHIFPSTLCSSNKSMEPIGFWPLRSHLMEAQRPQSLWQWSCCSSGLSDRALQATSEELWCVMDALRTQKSHPWMLSNGQKNTHQVNFASSKLCSHKWCHQHKTSGSCIETGTRKNTLRVKAF